VEVRISSSFLVFLNSSIGVFRACNLRGNLASPKNVVHSKETSLKSQLHTLSTAKPLVTAADLKPPSNRNILWTFKVMNQSSFDPQNLQAS